MKFQNNELHVIKFTVDEFDKRPEPKYCECSPRRTSEDIYKDTIAIEVAEFILMDPGEYAIMCNVCGGFLRYAYCDLSLSSLDDVTHYVAEEEWSSNFNFTSSTEVNEDDYDY